MIGSFSINHKKLKPGVYVSGQYLLKNGGVVTTFDLRFLEPNGEEFISQAGLHTIEHLGATYFREYSTIKDKIIYFGPMGCRTGFYLVVEGYYSTAANSEIIQAVLEMLGFIITFDKKIPGASEKECGNYKEHSLKDAKKYADKYLGELIDNTRFEYPKK